MEKLDPSVESLVRDYQSLIQSLGLDRQQLSQMLHSGNFFDLPDATACLESPESDGLEKLKALATTPSPDNASLPQKLASVLQYEILNNLICRSVALTDRGTIAADPAPSPSIAAYPPIGLAHHRRQHPVGQGFFHTGRLRLGAAEFHYVYDCGSTDSAALAREISACADEIESTRGIDVLFISHLDFDHVSGLDCLLAARSATTVVLPYLTPLERLMLAAEAADADRGDVRYLQLLSDPTRWFGDRGVEQVIYIRGDTSDEGPLPELPSDPTLPDAGTRIELRQHRYPPPPDHVRQTALGTSVSAIVLAHTVPLTLLVDGQGCLNWMFLPFVHPEVEREQRFHAEVREKFPEIHLLDDASADENNRRLLTVMQSGNLRRQLAECYAVVRKNRNLTSLSVYSGPIRLGPGFRATYQLLTGYDRWPCAADAPCGWLGTGDANLKSAGRLRAWKRHYQEVAGLSSTMAIPHHGSRHNFSEDLLDPSIATYVASAGQDSQFKHPDPEIKLMINSIDRPFLVVSEAPRSLLWELVTLQQRR